MSLAPWFKVKTTSSEGSPSTEKTVDKLRVMEEQDKAGAEAKLATEAETEEQAQISARIAQLDGAADHFE
eukprot:11357454-Alexandrium_andersonii.AAC.1